MRARPILSTRSLSHLSSVLLLAVLSAPGDRASISGAVRAGRLEAPAAAVAREAHAAAVAREAAERARAGGPVRAEVIAARTFDRIQAPPAPPSSGFAPQTRPGFPAG